MSSKSRISVKWLHSYKVKIPALLAVFFFLIVTTIAIVLYVVGKDHLDDIAYDKINQAGQTVVRELNTRVSTATTLVDTLANLAEQLPADVELHQRLFAHLIDYQGTENYIAGGGIWPEPYQFDSTIERRSFFWGRDKKGTLKYFENYNDLSGPGYHQEEWYVPAKYLSEGKTYWSKSYIDPYSMQPMVTVTAPIYKDKKHQGAATVDLKLEGLHELLQTVTSAFKGYAFAVDRNGTFLSFPDESLAKKTELGVGPNSLSPFVTIAEISTKIPEFSSITALLNKENEALQKNTDNNACFNQLPEMMAQESYQIGIKEAKFITLALCQSSQPKFLHQQLFLDNDYFLKEAAFVSIITMPVTYWRIITVIPYSSAIAPGIKIYNKIVATALLAALISLIIMMIMLRRFFSHLSVLSTDSEESESFSYLQDADSSLPMPETVQAMPYIGSWRWNIAKNSLWWSEELYQFYGRDQRKFKPTLKYLVRNTLHPDDVDNVLSIVKNAIKNQKTCGVEFRVKLKNNTVRYIHVQGKIVYDPFKQPLVITGTAADITKQRELQVDLVLSATTFQTQDPIIITDTDARIIKVNNAFTEVTGYKAEEVLGKDPSFLKSGRQDSAFYDRLWQELKENGQFEGEIWNRHKNGSISPQRITITATKNEQGTAINYIAIYSAVEQIKSKKLDTLNLVFYDPLTHLPNRRLLINRMEQEIKIAQNKHLMGSMLMINLDHFQKLNDSLGLKYGDELLAQLSKRLNVLLENNYTAARLGGDQFAVILPAHELNIDAAHECALLFAKKIKAALNKSYQLFDQDFDLTCCISIDVFTSKTQTTEVILQHLDTAMKQAKNCGRNRITVFEQEMQFRSDSQQLEPDIDLKKALQLNQFSLVYLPQIDSSGQCHSSEALLRWNHIDKGTILPNVLINLAEQTGLYIDLCEWVINEACRQLKHWRSQGYDLEQLSINVSLRQFRHEDFISIIKNALDSHQIDGHRLCIEVTEQIIIDNIKEALRIIGELKALGIAISIDDFGTGYSSLTQLKQLPLDQLKIDRQLVAAITTNENTAVIVETIIAMANHLNLNIVAEGVETEQQKQFLFDNGCVLYQGFLFSKPLNPKQFLKFVKQKHVA